MLIVSSLFFQYTVLVKDKQHLFFCFLKGGFFMYDKYLVTGATGFLGRAVVEELARRDAQVRALVLPDDPYAHLLPKKVRSIAGDVCDKDALASFFADADSRTWRDPLCRHRLRCIQARPQALPGQCGRDMEDPPAMYSPPV